MMINELLLEKYRAQKAFAEQAGYDVAQYIADTHASAREIAAKYGLKLKYGVPGEPMNIELPKMPWVKN